MSETGSSRAACPYFVLLSSDHSIMIAICHRDARCLISNTYTRLLCLKLYNPTHLANLLLKLLHSEVLQRTEVADNILVSSGVVVPEHSHTELQIIFHFLFVSPL